MSFLHLAISRADLGLYGDRSKKDDCLWFGSQNPLGDEKRKKLEPWTQAKNAAAAYTYNDDTCADMNICNELKKNIHVFLQSSLPWNHHNSTGTGDIHFENEKPLTILFQPAKSLLLGFEDILYFNSEIYSVYLCYRGPKWEHWNNIALYLRIILGWTKQFHFWPFPHLQ